MSEKSIRDKLIECLRNDPIIYSTFGYDEEDDRICIEYVDHKLMPLIWNYFKDNLAKTLGLDVE